MKQFYLFVRDKKSGIFYAQLRNPKTGDLLPAKSTGVQNREKAAFIAQKWLYEGVPESQTKKVRNVAEVFTADKILNDLKQIPFTKDDVDKFIRLFKSRGFLSGDKSKTDLIKYLEEFWSYDTSLYIKAKLAHGQKIGRAYADNSLRLIKKYWMPYFKGKVLQDITRQNIEEFSLHLSTTNKTDRYGKELEGKLSAQTINHILKAGSVALRDAEINGLIENNPMQNIMKFSGKRKRRGILTDAEVKKLFTVDWTGTPGNKLGNLVAMQTGLRLGEIRGLRVKNLMHDRVIVEKSWNDTIGEKTTKTGETRQIPITPILYKELMDHARQSPWGVSPDSFIFWSMESPDKPQGGRTMLRAFNTALKMIGVTREEQRARGLVFHSWRHYFAKKMSIVLDQRAMKLTGHATAVVFEQYAKHADEKDFKKAFNATSEVFGRVLNFQKAE